MKITLCGSARFESLFKEWNKSLTLAGHVVYSLACYPSDNGGKDWYSEVEKQTLDLVHLEKINNSDVVFVIGDSEYMGESTVKEIEWAHIIGKRVLYSSQYQLASDVQ